MSEWTPERIFALLETIPDPEVPAVSIVELGIVRGVERDGNATVVVLTPTYSGCPAMAAIEQSIRETLAEAGLSEVHVRITLSPPWTTDSMSESAREKLRAYGIAPPVREELVALPTRIRCPFCGSDKSRLTSEFGSTACKAFYFCDGCNQPFEYFKRY